MERNDRDHPAHAYQDFYQLNPSHRFTRTWDDPQRTWRWWEGELTMGDRVQRALAGGENFPLDRPGEDPGDARAWRMDHVASLALDATDPHPPPHPVRDRPSRHHPGRRPPER